MEVLQQTLHKIEIDELNKQQAEDAAREKQRVSLMGHIKSEAFVVTLRFMENTDILKILCLSKGVRHSFMANIPAFRCLLELFGSRCRSL